MCPAARRAPISMTVHRPSWPTMTSVCEAPCRIPAAQMAASTSRYTAVTTAGGRETGRLCPVSVKVRAAIQDMRVRLRRFPDPREAQELRTRAAALS